MNTSSKTQRKRRAWLDHVTSQTIRNQNTRLLRLDFCVIYLPLKAEMRQRSRHYGSGLHLRKHKYSATANIE
ncbi:hypothetical protein Cob_v000825 [Colletotrichum orbiculare MAFF 240422]|uniref:Uncharacterized protein n=1 Tax=Colletotrichum orbiculare (strain 104-T / ATCC 96160 / CBS 514.97 / LARS 414 / MAFF 240422) TaxID=1213857 RepID=A0A484G8C4_COLOR|nr:hypothetical protein Cob_v000825 [Colletotrichum orbiculare MAFF 240422]